MTAAGSAAFVGRRHFRGVRLRGLGAQARFAACAGAAHHAAARRVRSAGRRAQLLAAADAADGRAVRREAARIELARHERLARVGAPFAVRVPAARPRVAVPAASIAWGRGAPVARAVAAVGGGCPLRCCRLDGLALRRGRARRLRRVVVRGRLGCARARGDAQGDEQEREAERRARHGPDVSTARSP